MFTKRDVLQKALSDALQLAAVIAGDESAASKDPQIKTRRIAIDIVDGRWMRTAYGLPIPQNELKQYRRDKAHFERQERKLVGRKKARRSK